MKNNTYAWLWACGIAVAIIFSLLLWIRGTMPEPVENRQGTGPGHAGRTASAPVSASGSEASENVPATPRVTIPPPPPPPPPDLPGKKSALAEDLPGPRDPTWKFSERDLAKAGSGVELDLGDYFTREGTEFTVELILDAPALTSLMLVLNYDTELLEYIPESAECLGGTFRRGIEFYSDPETERLVLLHAGLPGQKNMLPADRKVVASFRMKASRSGTTRFTIPEQETSFTNGLLEEEDYTIIGGEIVIQ